LAAVRKTLEKSKSEHPVIGVAVRPLLWAALLAMIHEENWSSYWTLADAAGEIRTVTRPIADLYPQAVSASA
jgi:hypothetical protein